MRDFSKRRSGSPTIIVVGTLIILPETLHRKRPTEDFQNYVKVFPRTRGGKGLLRASPVRYMTSLVEIPIPTSLSHLRSTDVVDLDSSRDTVVDRRYGPASKHARTEKNNGAPSQTGMQAEASTKQGQSAIEQGLSSMVLVVETIAQGLCDLHHSKSLWRANDVNLWAQLDSHVASLLNRDERLESIKQHYEEARADEDFVKHQQEMSLLHSRLEKATETSAAIESHAMECLQA
ncbi:uncharacterized protein G2W53_033569 [Senna tora]|uniref:Uncharacterized protein n=1 Tax=Senna tora TaxID=362788 RepID=A0A834SZF2_9FABA|nr:uncharacterized protein G2W53_033569 [Senna tora]